MPKVKTEASMKKRKEIGYSHFPKQGQGEGGNNWKFSRSWVKSLDKKESRKKGERSGKDRKEGGDNHYRPGCAGLGKGKYRRSPCRDAKGASYHIGQHSSTRRNDRPKKRAGCSGVSIYFSRQTWGLVLANRVHPQSNKARTKKEKKREERKEESEAFRSYSKKGRLRHTNLQDSFWPPVLSGDVVAIRNENAYDIFVGKRVRVIAKEAPENREGGEGGVVQGDQGSWTFWNLEAPYFPQDRKIRRKEKVMKFFNQKRKVRRIPKTKKTEN